MHDRLTVDWGRRQQEACADGRCKYRDLANDNPTAKDSGDCHGWRVSTVLDGTRQDGSGFESHVALSHCPRCVQWINATAARRAQRSGPQAQPVLPPGWT